MIVAKILLLSPLLLLANAQGGGRFGFFGRPNFRIPRPWERPTAAPVPDTPMPTEKVTERVTDAPEVRMQLPTPVRITSAPSLYSVNRLPPRGGIWTRPVFGYRPSATSTAAAITPTELTTTKAEDHSPVVAVTSASTEPAVFIVTPSIRVPFVDNHAKYQDPNNFNSRGRYTPKLTHNTDEIIPDSKTTIPNVQSTTEKIVEFSTQPRTTPAQDDSPQISSTLKAATVSVTVAPATKIPFINNDIKFNESMKNNWDTGFPSQASVQLNGLTSESITTPVPLTTPRLTFIPTSATNFNPSPRYPPYTSHTLNGPTNNIRPQSIPSNYSKTTEATLVPTVELTSSATESPEYKVSSSTNLPSVDEQKKKDDIYLTTKTPIPFKIISTTEASPSTYKYNSIYQSSYNEEYNITNNSELPIIVIPKVTMATKEPDENIIRASTKIPLAEEHKEYNGFTSQPPVEYTNGYEKISEVSSTSEDYNFPISPVYHQDSDNLAHYEDPSLAIATTAKAPFIDTIYDGGFTSGPPVYTNGHEKFSEVPSSFDDFKFIDNIYQNSDKENFKHSSSPKTAPAPQPSYEYQRPQIMDQTAPAQNVRYTNINRYPDTATKPTPRYIATTTIKPSTLITATTTIKPSNRYTTPATTKPSTRWINTTTTTLKPSYVVKNKINDIENFRCKNEDGYYSIPNQCDDFIQCKSGYPIQNTCPDGLHFNPAAKYPEFPCAYPSEVKCEINSALRKAEPTSECPRRYGYFSMQDGSCDKYIMCQEGQATVMSCPAGLAFSVATSSCDWPSNVPDCLPGVFQGFTCPPPELNEDGQPTHNIYKFRYDKSCKKYIACQRGHPRLLSCDAGLAFDERSESCVDEFDVTDCT